MNNEQLKDLGQAVNRLAEVLESLPAEPMSKAELQLLAQVEDALDRRAVIVAIKGVSNEQPVNESHDWLIWSYQHNAWWRPGRMGYTHDPNKVGRYTVTEALAICNEANRYSRQINETMVHVSMLHQWTTKISHNERDLD